MSRTILAGAAGKLLTEDKLGTCPTANGTRLLSSWQRMAPPHCHYYYNLGMLQKAAFFVVSFALANAAVTRVEIASRADLPVANYERITGKVYFAVDPTLTANQIITDIALAPRN